jgi:hypothetical protein
MQEPTQAAVREVPIEIYDFTRPERFAENGHVAYDVIQPGFYYSIPMHEDEKVASGEIALAGPFSDRSAALDAARDFVRDCLTNHTTGEEE